MIRYLVLALTAQSTKTAYKGDDEKLARNAYEGESHAYFTKQEVTLNEDGSLAKQTTLETWHK